MVASILKKPKSAALEANIIPDKFRSKQLLLPPYKSIKYNAGNSFPPG